jgi:hypothetical protein
MAAAVQGSVGRTSMVVEAAEEEATEAEAEVKVGGQRAAGCVDSAARILSGGRLDLRREAEAMALAAATEGRWLMEERRWVLTRHALENGWPSFQRLLLGV